MREVQTWQFYQATVFLTYLQADSPVGSGNQRNFLFGHSLYLVVNHYIQVV